MVYRFLQTKITPWLEREEIIFINGPRQVGKTTLMKRVQKEFSTEGRHTFFYNLENPNDLELTENYEYFLKTILARKSPKEKTIVFLDEIQLHSKPSNFLKWLFDEHRRHIKLFVSGSANLDIKAKFQDSLAGRKKTFWLTPFNFSEFLEAKQFHADPNPIINEKQLQLLLDEYLLYGGLPKIVLENDTEIKKQLLDEYTATYISKDIRHMIAENHILTFNKLLIYLAKIMGSLKNNAEMSKELGMNHLTLQRYLDLLQYTFVVDFLMPYFTNEITRLKKASKVYFFDNGVRNSLLSNFSEMDKRTDTGALFENCVYLHLKQKYAKTCVFYLRTASGNEIDFVCKTHADKLHLYEVKYSSLKEPAIERGLAVLLNKINFEKAFLVNKNLNKLKKPLRFVSFSQFNKNLSL